MNTIPMDVDNTKGDMSRDDAAAAFLERWKDPKEVSEDGKGADPDDDETVVEGETPEAEEDPGEVETEEDLNASEDEEEPKHKSSGKVAEDDAEVSFTVDGVEHKASVKELKRLAGQEAALTRKSQEVAAERKVVDDTKNLHFTALNTLVQRAEARYKPFAEIDMLLASKTMSDEDFQAVRQEANAAYQDLQFLSQELGQMTQKAQQEHQQSVAQAAGECIKALVDPKTGIPGWSQKLYDDIRVFAKGAGMAANVVDNITDPAAIRMMHDAMKYRQMKQVATTKKIGSVKKPIKSTTNISSSKDSNSGSVKTAMARLKATGSRQNAADAFLAKWKEAD